MGLLKLWVCGGGVAALMMGYLGLSPSNVFMVSLGIP
jgi:hypothetical protein